MEIVQPGKLTSTLEERRIKSSNKWLLWVFSFFWLVDGGLTLWATNNGYQEVWNQWTTMIGHTWAFAVVKVLTLVVVVWIARRATNMSPYILFIALAVFNILIVTVTAANIVTLLK
jgi:uncharacterized membrane protein